MKFDLNNVTCKKVSVSDIDILIDYRIQFMKEMQGEFPDLEKNIYSTLKKYFLKAMKNDTFVAFIAEYHSIPVSFGGMVIREQPGHFLLPSGSTGYIMNMYTVPEFRKKGISSKILENLIKEGKKRKLGKIELHATKAGEPVYRRQGFTEPHEVALELILI